MKLLIKIGHGYRSKLYVTRIWEKNRPKQTNKTHEEVKMPNCRWSGYFKMDRVFKSLPRPVLMGCVAGMGSYLLFYGLGTSTSVDWLWTQEALREQGRNWQKLMVTVALEGLLLYLLQRAKHRDLVGLWLPVSARFLLETALDLRLFIDLYCIYIIDQLHHFQWLFSQSINECWFPNHCGSKLATATWDC